MITALALIWMVATTGALVLLALVVALQNACALYRHVRARLRRRRPVGTASDPAPRERVPSVDLAASSASQPQLAG